MLFIIRRTEARNLPFSWACGVLCLAFQHMHDEKYSIMIKSTPPGCQSMNKLKSGEHRLSFHSYVNHTCCSLRKNRLLFTVNPGATVSGVGSLKYLPRLFNIYDSSFLHTFGSAQLLVSPTLM